MFIALGIQHATRLSTVACLALQYISTLSHKRNDFRKNKLLNTKCVLIFSVNLSEIFLILKRTEPDVIKNVYWSLRKIPLILVRV